VPLIGIAKGPHHGREGREVFHFPDGREKTLPVNSPVLFYLQRLRDEVHRFAIGAHRTKRSRRSPRARWTRCPASAPRASGAAAAFRHGAAKCGMRAWRICSAHRRVGGGRAGGVTGEQVGAKRQELRVNMANAIQERRLDEDVLLDMYSVTCKDIFGIAAPPQTTGRLVQPSAATYPGFAAIAGKTWRCSMTVPDYRDDMDDVLTFAVNVGFGVEKNFKVTGTIQFGVNFEGESSPHFATYQIGGWGYETQWSYGPYVKFYTTVNEMALPRGRWPTYPIQFYITKQADGTFQLSGQLDRASDLKRINLEYCSVITP
jgi:hypothetical protein